MNTIGLASDHAGYELKEYIKTWLEAKGYSFKDFGTYSAASCDYADFAHPLALAVESGECYPGIAVCGSGQGIGITLNKHHAYVLLYVGFRRLLIWPVNITMRIYWLCQAVLLIQKWPIKLWMSFLPLISKADVIKPV